MFQIVHYDGEFMGHENGQDEIKGTSIYIVSVRFIVISNEKKIYSQFQKILKIVFVYIYI